MPFSLSEFPDWVLHYRSIWKEIELQLYEKMTTELIKREGKYMYGKLEMRKEHVKMNFHGQEVTYTS